MDEEVANCLSATFSADANTRMAAELRLGEVQAHGEAGLSLARIALHTSADISLRQAAALALRRYVRDRWSAFSASFKGNAPSEEIKVQIRETALLGLSDEQRKIRTACAFTVSEIAHSDWPDVWTALMPHLLSLLNSRLSIPTSGAMLVLSELVRTDLTEDQLVPLARDLLPMLGQILESPDEFEAFTRARCVSVFRQCLASLYMVKDAFPDAVKTATAQIVPQWLAAFRSLLSSPLEPEISDPTSEGWNRLAIRAEAFKTLESILSGFPKSLAEDLVGFVNLAANHLEALWPVYQSAYLDPDSLVSLPTKDESSNDFETDLARLTALIMDFLRHVANKPAPRKSLTGEVVGKAVLAGFRFAEVTCEDEQTWEEDINAFVDDEDDEMVAFSSRAVAEDLLDAFVEELGTPALEAVVRGMSQVINESNQAKASGSGFWWKGYEAVLTLVGSIAEKLSEHADDAGAASLFNLGEMFEQIVSPNLTCSDHPFLQGRCFVFSSQFAASLPVQHAERIAAYGCDALQSPDVGVLVKLSIVRALRNFFRHLPDVVAPHSLRVLGELVTLLPQTSEATTVLLIETMQAALKPAQDSLDQAVLDALLDALLSTWSKAVSDPLLVDSISDLLSTLSESPSPVVLSSLRSHALPRLSMAMTSIDQDPSSSAIKVSASELVGSIFNGRPSPIGEGLFAAVAGGLFAAIEGTDDGDVLQNGMNVLTSVIRKDVEQLMSWQNPATGQSGLDHLLRVIAHVLDPAQSESGGLFVGDLILHLFRKAGNAVVPVLPDLLKGLATRVAMAKTATFTQSMILPFAYLIHSQLDTVLSLLESFTVPVPSGGEQSALKVVLAAWCDNVDTFQGFWNLRVSTVALTQLYLSSRPSLSEVTARGNLIITEKNMNTIMTRAKTRANPDQFEAIPFYAKVLKVLAGELQSTAAEQAGIGGDPAIDLEDDDGDDDWEDDGGGLSSKTQQDLLQLSDMLGPGAKHILTDDDEDPNADDDDPDLREDPLYTLDLYAHLSGFFRHVYECDVQGAKVLATRWLSAEELAVVSAVLA